jgi:RNA polymerase-binding transcription factor DksA
MSNPKQQLEAMLASVNERRLQISRHTEKRPEPLPADFAEQATELLNEETISELDVQLTQEHRLIEQALKRLDQGLYNICEKCEKPIDEKRRQALPETILCIGCADQ